MTDRPIIFSGPMVRALLDGTKIQTRRILKQQPPTPEEFPGAMFGLSRAVAPDIKIYSLDDCDRLPKHPANWDLCGCVGRARDAGYPTRYNARVAIGDRLWVREAWRVWDGYDETPPRDLAADTIVVYDVGGSSEASEGYRRTSEWPATQSERPKGLGKLRQSMFMPRKFSRLTLTVTGVRVQRLHDISEEDAIAEGIERADDPVARFASLWDACYGPEAWGANPWVVATTFTVHRCNIDQMEAGK